MLSHPATTELIVSWWRAVRIH